MQPNEESNLRMPVRLGTGYHTHKCSSGGKHREARLISQVSNPEREKSAVMDEYGYPKNKYDVVLEDG